MANRDDLNEDIAAGIAAPHDSEEFHEDYMSESEAAIPEPSHQERSEEEEEYNDGYGREFDEGNEELKATEKDGESTIANIGSQLSSTPARNMLFIIILVIASSYMIYTFIIKSEIEKRNANKDKEISRNQPLTQATELPKDTSKTDTDFRQIDEPEQPNVGNVNAKDNNTINVSGLDVPEPFLDQNTSNLTPPVLPQQPTQAPTNPNAVETPQLTTPPNFQAPQNPQLAPPPVNNAPGIVAQPVGPIGPSQEQLAAELQAKRNSSMLVKNGGGEPGGKQNEVGKDGTVTMKDVTQTSAEKAIVGKLNNTDYLIAQGKIINAVLETAINTDLPGTLRAIISRDIYSESNRNILIPKGSRLIGTYQNNVSKGQKRVLITWDRIILTNGLDIMVKSPGVDALGRAGVRGLVDNKYYEIFKNSFLLSALSIGAAAVSGGSISNNSTTGNGQTSNTQTGTATDLAVLNAGSDLSGIAKELTKGQLTAQPTIIVDQGTLINVFVNRDLVFPADKISGGTKVIE